MHIPFIGGSYKARSSAVNMQECVNWYLPSSSSMGDIDQIYGGLTKKDAKSQKVLLPTPGLKLFATGSASGAVRGIYTAVSDRLFAIMNNKLVEYNKYGKEYVRGTLKTKIGPVNMADNGEGSGRGRGLILTDRT